MDSSTLPCSADSVFDMNINLWSIERAVAFVYHIFFSQVFKCIFQASFSKFPIFFVTDMIFRHCAEFQVITKTKNSVHFVNKLQNAFDFLFYLAWQHKYMRIVLCKASYSEKSVQRSACFVAVYFSKFPHTNWQVFVRMDIFFVNQNSARAVHWFDCKVFIFNFEGVHIFFVVVPVTRNFPKSAVHSHRCFDFDIARFSVHFTPIVNQKIFDNQAFWQIKWHTLCVI